MKIFISHSSEDEKLVKFLVMLLERALVGLAAKEILCSSLPGYRLAPGDTVGETLKEKVCNAGCFLALITQQSLKSTYVSFELGARWGNNKKIIPILSPDVPIQEIKAPLNEFNSIRSNNPSDLHDLIDSLSEKLKFKKNRTSAFNQYIDTLVNFTPPLFELLNVKNTENDDSFMTKTFTVTTTNDAKTAELLADFTDWEAAPIKMEKIRDELFGVTLRLKKATYKFKYKVDGKWKQTMTDDAPTIRNHHGSYNYIIEN